MNPQSLTETLTNVVNLRGELVGQSYSPNPNYTYPAHRSTTNSGYRDTRAYSQDPSVTTPDGGTEVDGLNGIAVGSSSNGDSSAPNYQNNRTTFTFDAGGRQTRTSDVTDSFWTFVDDRTGLSRQNRTHSDNETVKTYDAENHTQSYHPSTTSSSNGTPQPPVDQGISTIGWGPNGHPVQQILNDRGTGVPYTLHWDGDALLFVSDGAGNVVDFKVGTDGETAPSNTGGVTVYDRDTAGVVVLTSNATGNSGLQPLDSSDLSGPSYPGTSGYQPPTRSYFDTNRADGYNFGTFRINGVRAFDAKLGSWTTPDAYAGDVHDPASQQRYMWNRNNPYEYSDPSGYEPVAIDAGLSQVFQETLGAQTIARAGPFGADFHRICEIIYQSMSRLSGNARHMEQLTADALASAISAKLISEHFTITKTYRDASSAIILLVAGASIGGDNEAIGRYTIGISPNGRAVTGRIVELRGSEPGTFHQVEFRFLHSAGTYDLYYRDARFEKGAYYGW
jgi:hypothetical protein